MPRPSPTHRIPKWITVASLSLAAAGVISGCGLFTAQGGEEKETFDCDYNPVGIGSWGPGASLAEFRDADLLAKVKVTGHRGRQSTSGLLNELNVLTVLKGDVAPGDRVFASSGGGVCLPNGDEFYLYLRGPAGGSPVSGEPEGDPSAHQPRGVYYIVHPYAQFLIADGRVNVYEPFRTDDLPSQFHGITEQELEQRLRDSLG